MVRKLGVAFAILAACHAQHDERRDASAASASDASPKVADYMTLHDALAAGDAALGKTVLTQAYRRRMDRKSITLISCWDLPADPYVSHELHLTYPAALRPEVRAMRRSLVEKDHRCPRVVFRLQAVDRKNEGRETSIAITGAIERVTLDVPPWTPPTMPAGVDYVSFDDIDMDGSAAEGKLAELTVQLLYPGDPLRFPPVHDGTFEVAGCGESEELETGTAITVHFTPAQQKSVDAFAAAAPLSCHTVRVKLGKRNGDGTSWDATLVAAR